jgi:hypothetical protein
MDIFSFFAHKKRLLMMVIKIKFLPPHLMHLNILFLPEQHVYNSGVWFRANWLFFFSFFSFSFYFGLHVGHA